MSEPRSPEDSQSPDWESQNWDWESEEELDEELHRELDRILTELFLTDSYRKRHIIVVFRLTILSFEKMNGEMKNESK